MDYKVNIEISCMNKPLSESLVQKKIKALADLLPSGKISYDSSMMEKYAEELHHYNAGSIRYVI